MQTFFIVVIDIAGSNLFVKSQATRSGGRQDVKPRYQVLTADLSDEAHAQLYKREAVSLRLGQVGKLFYRHPGWPIWINNSWLGS